MVEDLPIWAVLAIFLAVLLPIVGGVRLGRWWMARRDWRTPIEHLPDPVPAAWRGIVRRNVPLAGRLPEADFERLLKIMQVFLRSKRIEGAGGLEITEEIAVTIAAQACFLLLWLEVGCYPGLKTVLVYPGSVRQKRPGVDVSGGFGVSEGPQAIRGESWGRGGMVVLAWDAARHGAYDPSDGENLVFHEFAHQLDQDAGEADGVPVGVKLPLLSVWSRVIDERLEYLRDAVRDGVETVMRPYGATNRAEFFAVATEAFFERPRQLRASKPDLYEQLADLYGVDPVEHPAWS